MNNRYILYKNDQGFYRMLFIDANNRERWFLDEDTMSAVIGSHRSSVMTFTTKSAALTALGKYFDRCKPKPTLESIIIVNDTFQPICDHENDGLTYTSDPPQYRCVKCKEFYL